LDVGEEREEKRRERVKSFYEDVKVRKEEEEKKEDGRRMSL
jgi:hypothetical protein